jgi:hypothetical protein
MRWSFSRRHFSPGVKTLSEPLENSPRARTKKPQRFSTLPDTSSLPWRKFLLALCDPCLHVALRIQRSRLLEEQS